jgi:hypothetical protein
MRPKKYLIHQPSHVKEHVSHPQPHILSTLPSFITFSKPVSRLKCTLNPLANLLANLLAKWLANSSKPLLNSYIIAIIMLTC